MLKRLQQSLWAVALSLRALLTAAGDGPEACIVCIRTDMLCIVLFCYVLQAIKVVMLAQEEARRLGHNFVGTEQILLGLIGESTGIAAKVLKSMGVNLKDARVEVEKIIGRGSGFVAVEIPFTPRAKRVLELSLEEARQLGRLIVFWQQQECLLASCRAVDHLQFEPVLLPNAAAEWVDPWTRDCCCCRATGHNYIGTEHILLGLLREGEGVAARVLETLGADPSKIRTQVSQNSNSQAVL